MTHTLTRKAAGSDELAQSIASRAINEIEAYQAYVAQHGIVQDSEFSNLPFTDKANYITQFPWRELIGKDYAQTFTIFASSGSSGAPLYWPQLKESYLEAEARLRLLLESAFRVHEKKTMVIIGLALGSWIGGDHFSWLFKSTALNTPYPLAVFSPGNKYDEIIAMLRSASPFVDQFIFVCCPSAIGHLTLRAEQAGKALPLDKMRYLVIGEPFSETLRTGLEASSGVLPGEAAMLSIYGSADTGVIGFESPASVVLRQAALSEPEIAAELELTGPVPHFFHHADPGVYLETHEGELCITRWQGVPLIRYNLHDQAQLYDWPSIAQRFPLWGRRYPKLAPMISRLDPSLPIPLPGLIAITGRTDSCLILCGTNISEGMLDDAVRSVELRHALTGVYRARLLLEDGRQRLGLTLEYNPAQGTPEVVAEAVYPELIRSLGRVQPEFQDDWANIYRFWDDEPAQRILKLELVAWPHLSSGMETKIKQRGIEK